ILPRKLFETLVGEDKDSAGSSSGSRVSLVLFANEPIPLQDGHMLLHAGPSNAKSLAELIDGESLLLKEQVSEDLASRVHRGAIPFVLTHIAHGSSSYLIKN